MLSRDYLVEQKIVVSSAYWRCTSSILIQWRKLDHTFQILTKNRQIWETIIHLILNLHRRTRCHSFCLHWNSDFFNQCKETNGGYFINDHDESLFPTPNWRLLKIITNTCMKKRPACLLLFVSFFSHQEYFPQYQILPPLTYWAVYTYRP